MRILHTSDWHVGRTIRGRSRHHEHERVLAGIARLVETEGVDLVVVAGDQFDSPVPSATSERLVYRALLAFVERGAKVVVVAGNHDNAARLEAVAPLLSRGGDITVAPHVRDPDHGGVVRVATGGGDAQVALVPFLSQRGIVKAADLLDRDAAQHAQQYAQRVGVVVGALTAGFGGGDTVDVLVGHLTVVGTGSVADRLGGGERTTHIFDYVVPPQTFPDTAHYVALGHLHQPHDVPGPAPIRYCGSPLHLDFGEAVSARGVTIVEASPDTPARITHHPLRGGWALLTLRGTLEQLEAAAADLDDHTYVRAVVDGPPRAGLAEQVRAVVPHAVDVRVEPDSDDVDPDPLEADDAAAADPTRLFADYVASRGIDDERVAALFAQLLDEVEAVRSGRDAVGGAGAAPAAPRPGRGG